MLLERLRSHWVLVSILLILVLATAIRFWDIFSVGLVHWDSGYFVRTAAWLIGQGGAPYPWEPAGFSAIVAAAFTLFGVHDYVAIGVSAFFGVLTVFLTFLIARRFFNNKVGLIAALLLAVSEYHIIFSRLALTDIVFTFFFALAMLAFMEAFKRKSLRYYLLFGILSGITLDIKYNGFQTWMIGLSFIIIYYAYKRLSRGFVSRDIFTDSKGMLLAFIIMALLHLPWIILLGAGSIMQQQGVYSFSVVQPYMNPGGIGTLFTAGMQQYADLSVHKTEAISLSFATTDLSRFSSYPSYLFTWGSPLLILFLLLWIPVLYKRNKHDLLILLWLLLIILFFTLFGAGRPRTIVPVLPALAIAAARGLAWLRSDRLILILLAITAVTSVYTSLDSLHPHNAFRQTGQWLNENTQEIDLIFFTGGPQLQFYYEQGNFFLFSAPKPASEIKYAVLEFHKYRENRLQHLDTKTLESTQTPLATFENHYFWLDVRPEFEEGIPDYSKVKIYRLA